MNSDYQNSNPENISSLGDEIYFSELQDKLEAEHRGEYVVIEVESKDYFVDQDLMAALNKARKKYPKKLFHIIQIGTISKPTINSRDEKYAWIF